MKLDCSLCHTSDGWKVRETKFDHQSTSFALTGQHQSIDCKQCHTTLVFKDGRRQCVDCHKDIHSQTLGRDCERCHTPKTWFIQEITQLHQQTRFPLTGAHKALACSDCHTSALNFKFEPLGIQCIDCHLKDFQNTTNPDHANGRFSTDCLECHDRNTTNWHSAMANHDFFPLTGGHAVGCGQCHKDGHYTKIPTDCNSCHNKVFVLTTDPNHVAAGIPARCEDCHNIKAWAPSTFNHQTTGYELKDAHKSIAQCADCHKGNLTSAGTTCIQCHQTQYDKAPDHKAQGYATDCTVCHTQKNWLESIFNHAQTTFPLTGAHTTVQCSLCHTKGFPNTPTTCNSCHMPAYTSSKLPNHTAAGIQVDCALCHNATAWKPSSFNHATTGYVLNGAHKNIVQCSDCHKGNLTNAPQTCIACHQLQYNSAPDHVKGNYDTDCTKCHSQNNWLAASFDHSTTPFPLTGAHTTVLCSQCHPNGYPNTPTDCKSCHLTAYNAAQLPAHLTAGIPTDCKTCHATSAWKPSSFNHNTTGYALVGGHTTIVQCSDCHKGNVSTAPQTCIGCHQSQYNAAPSHTTQNYPVDCTKCHTQVNWLATNFNHSTTSFPLTGAHTTVLCSLCHTNGYSGGTPSACYNCHSAKYNATTNPNHVGANFPITCENCHSTANWTTSTYNHDVQFFPINSGHHKGAWTLCSECHTVASNYASFSCILCHTHSNKTSVDSKHRNVKNYSYVSSACLSCHPRG
ncbi:MAG: cytochrome c3 family protein [Marinilabiliales bacterium]|nr:cytochrome c3 family protein [Marinilabiliales bacterium]